MELIRHPASFRDPSGFVFSRDGNIYRQVNSYYKNDFDLLIQTGLYKSVVAKKMMISHQQVNENFGGTDDWYTTLLPEQIKYLSYPFEWSFDMLKDAALTTLNAAQEGLQFGMILKDASAYNIQFHKAGMILIDSLSFEKYDGFSPWIAYRQFCEHFLGPIFCMHYLKSSLRQLIFANTEGLDLALTKKMLPVESKFNLNALLHIHLHAGLSKSKETTKNKINFSATKLSRLLKSLEQAIRSCHLPSSSTVWSEYYEEVRQRGDYLEKKKEIIDRWVEQIPMKSAIDVGANDGTFSEILASKNIYMLSLDADPLTVNDLYQKIKKNDLQNIHPLVMDLANPTPSFGVNSNERASFMQRTKVDLVLALAVIHHLAISKHIPLESIAQLFSGLGKMLIIEFVPKKDQKVQMMLKNRKDVFFDYSEEGFLKNFSSFFNVLKSENVGNTERKLFLMERL